MNRILQVFQHTADGAWAVDSDQRIIFWNDAAEELLGYSPVEVMGEQCSNLLAGRDARGVPCCSAPCPLIDCARRGVAVPARTMRVRRRGRGTSWISVSFIAVPDGSGSGDPVLVHLCRPVAAAPGWPSPLRIYLLGQVEVQRADGSLVGGRAWRRAKVRALLGLLALQEGQAVHRDALLAALWPHLQYPAALCNLNTTVYNLRLSLEPALQRGPESAYVGYESDRYALIGGRLHWLDVRDFESVVTRACHEPQPGQARALYQEATALYRGELMADLGLGTVDCLRERDRLRERYLVALQQLATLQAREGQPEEATDTYLRVLAADPCHERAAQQLMRLAIQRGDRAAAAAHYRRLEQALWSELRILPSQETCLLLETALRGN